MSYQSETNWMDELDSKLRNLEELEAARAKEAWEKHVVSVVLAFTTTIITTRATLVYFSGHEFFSQSFWKCHLASSVKFGSQTYFPRDQ